MTSEDYTNKLEIIQPVLEFVDSILERPYRVSENVYCVEQAIICVLAVGLAQCNGTSMIDELFRVQKEVSAVTVDVPCNRTQYVHLCETQAFPTRIAGIEQLRSRWPSLLKRLGLDK